MQIFGIDRNWISIFTVIEYWWNLYCEELQDLSSTPNINRLIKSRIMRLAGNVARVREKTVIHRVLVGKT
jgi:hypothetical protein